MRFVFLLAGVVSLAAQPIEFNRDIRPILSDRCWTCHGSDAASKGIKLRLDQPEPVAAARQTIAERIVTTNKAKRMPPLHTGASLSTAEVALLNRWVEAGAPWQ